MKDKQILGMVTVDFLDSKLAECRLDAFDVLGNLFVDCAYARDQLAIQIRDGEAKTVPDSSRRAFDALVRLGININRYKGVLRRKGIA